MTRQEAIEEHRKMWNWIADKTLELKRVVKKREYLRLFYYYGQDWPLSNCFCCEYTKQNCTFCPFVWNNSCGKTVLRCYHDGEYTRWRLACISNNWKLAAELARQIANLSEKECDKHDDETYDIPTT